MSRCLKEQKIKIQAKSGLSEDEINAKIKEAEENADEDKKRKESVDTLNEADALIFRSEKALTDYKDKLPENVQSEVQTRIDALKKAKEGGGVAIIRTEIEALNTAIQKIGEAMQQAGGQPGAQPGPQPGPQASAAQEKPDIEDAEVEVLDEEEKS